MTTPHKAFRGLIARAAIQCNCPDTGELGTFLFSGETHRNPGSRVTPVYADLAEMYQAIRGQWEEISAPGTTGAYRKLP